MTTETSPFVVGESVIVRRSGAALENDALRMHCIIRITPTGIIVLDDGERFHTDGRSTHVQDRWGKRDHMYHATDMLRERLFRQEALARLKTCLWGTVSTATLRTIVTALEAEEQHDLR